jgi:apolipoprotein N-acyltransferase
VLLVPTNASSYRGTQVPGQELAAARLRALETGRALLQSAPTGYTAVVSPRGKVTARSGLGARAVLHATVGRRTGLTPAVRLGQRPVVGTAAAALALAWLVPGRRRGDPPLD